MRTPSLPVRDVMVMLLALVGLGCSSGPDAAPAAGEPRNVGQRAQAVGDGSADTSESLNFVGKFKGPNGGCSAVLITPTWALTAHHCIGAYRDFGGITSGCVDKGSVTGTNATLTLNFNYAGTNAPPLLTGVHSPGVSSQIKLLSSGKLDICSTASGGNSSLDLALIQLDARVPNAQYRTIPLYSESCGGDTMTVVGYGATVMSILHPTGTYGGNASRTFAQSSGWERHYLNITNPPQGLAFQTGRDLILSGNACRHWNPDLLVGEERRQEGDEGVPRMSRAERRTTCPPRSRSPTV